MPSKCLQNAFKIPSKWLQNARQNARNNKDGSNLGSVTRHKNNPVRVVTILYLKKLYSIDTKLTSFPKRLINFTAKCPSGLLQG
jgi:hypothetical protein